MLYRVVWEIDIEAKSYEAAARQALAIQRDPESVATYFSVFNDRGTCCDIDFEARRSSGRKLLPNNRR